MDKTFPKTKNNKNERYYDYNIVIWNNEILKDHRLNLFSKLGNVNRTPTMAIIMAKEVNIPNKMVGIKLDKARTENPKAIVIEVVKTAYPTLL